MDEQPVYTPAEAAEFARVSENTIRNAYRRGDLRAVLPRGHRHPKILRDDLMRWIEGLPPRGRVDQVDDAPRRV